jgi:dTDP-4-dehydrorhamnose 3,5-epimerase
VAPSTKIFSITCYVIIYVGLNIVETVVMEIKTTSIEGLILFRFPKFVDERGFFSRNFCADSLQQVGGLSIVSQANLSLNVEIGTLRGFHFQSGGYEEAKTVTVLSGAVHYKVIDLRKNSKTFALVESFDLNELEWSVQVPRGCAPAFQTLKPNTLLHYYVSHPYSAKHEGGIRFNDPCFNFKWPLEISAISTRDQGFPDFNINNFPGLMR